jgi:hypothetical protein
VANSGRADAFTVATAEAARVIRLGAALRPYWQIPLVHSLERHSTSNSHGNPTCWQIPLPPQLPLMQSALPRQRSLAPRGAPLVVRSSKRLRRVLTVFALKGKRSYETTGPL